MTSSASVVSVEECTLHYGRQTAFRDITLELHPRSITVLVGPSGCGKSSLLRVITRLTDHIPGTNVDGIVRVHGRDIRDWAPEDLRRRVALISQQPAPLPFSIRRNFEIVLRARRIPRSQWQARIDTVLHQTGLHMEVADRLDAPAETLSGGQQQRLCLARALLNDPSVLLLDEPTASLDRDATAHIEALILELARERTVLLVTHDLAQARRLADHLAFCWHDRGCGRLIEAGPADEVLAAPRHATTRAWFQSAATE